MIEMRKEAELEQLDKFHLEQRIGVLNKRRGDFLKKNPEKKYNEISEKVFQLRQKFIRA